MSILIAYYSRKGENYWSGQVKQLEKGNTEIVAEYIHDAIGGDLFEIETIQDYPSDYYDCIELAQQELDRNERPELKTFVDNMDAYDVIFLGYPNWWGTCPPGVFTFLEHYNLNDKRIVTFCTSEGSGFGHSVRDIKRICPETDVESGLAVIGNQAQDSKEQVQAWAKGEIA